MQPDEPQKKATTPAHLSIGRLERQLVWEGMEGIGRELTNDVIQDASSYALTRWQEQSLELFCKIYREHLRRLIGAAESSARAQAWSYIGRGDPAASKLLAETLEGMDTSELWTMQRDAENLADKIEGVLGNRGPDENYPTTGMSDPDEEGEKP